MQTESLCQSPFDSDDTEAKLGCRQASATFKMLVYLEEDTEGFFGWTLLKRGGRLWWEEAGSLMGREWIGTFPTE